jgi:hypothetical protein
VRLFYAVACFTGLAYLALAQQPATSANPDKGLQSANGSPDKALSDLFEAKIKTEWEALKNKDKKAYGGLLADDYQGVEVDGKGERTKTQAVNELVEENVFNYSLWGFKLIPIGTEGALVIYESTIQFPPRAQVRYSRVYISELWMKRAGQWKEVHYQETHVK